MRTTPLLVGAATVSLATVVAALAQEKPQPLAPRPTGLDARSPDHELSIECTVVDIYAHLTGSRSAKPARGEGGPIGIRPESPVPGAPMAQLLVLVFDSEQNTSALAYQNTGKMVGKKARLTGRLLASDGVAAFHVQGVEALGPNP